MNYTESYLGANGGTVQAGGFTLPPPPRAPFTPTSGGFITPGHMILDENAETVAILPSVTIKTGPVDSEESKAVIKAASEEYAKAKKELDRIETIVTARKYTDGVVAETDGNGYIEPFPDYGPGGKPVPSVGMPSVQQAPVSVKENNTGILLAVAAGIGAFLLMR